MDKISVRLLASAVRLIREPVVVTYSYPRNHPLYAAGEEVGVFVPLHVWRSWSEGYADGPPLPSVEPQGGVPLPSEGAVPTNSSIE